MDIAEAWRQNAAADTATLWKRTAVILLLLIIKTGNKKPLLILPAVYPLILVLLIFTGKAALPDTTEVTVFSMSGSEYFLTASNDGAVIIDASVGSLNGLRVMAGEMRKSGITEVDTLVLTHYHTAHLSSVIEFTSSEKVRRVLLPYPETEDDAWVMLQLSEGLARAGISCELISEDGTALVDGTKLALSPIRRLSRSTHPVFSFSISDGEETLVYLSASVWECDVEGIMTDLSEGKLVMFGSHGPVVKTPFGSPDRCKNAQEILIFDEATSALDPESEQLIRDNLKAIAKDRTVIIVSHRLSIISGADQILTLENGEMTSLGTHKELLAQPGVYRNFWRQQMEVED